MSTIKYSVFALLLVCNTAFARIEGVSYGDIEVQGKKIEFPLGNKDRENEYYYLKKAVVEKDTIAREIFMGSSGCIRKQDGSSWWYIGEETPRWLKVTKDSMEVVTP